LDIPQVTGSDRFLWTIGAGRPSPQCSGRSKGRRERCNGVMSTSSACLWKGCKQRVPEAARLGWRRPNSRSALWRSRRGVDSPTI